MDLMQRRRELMMMGGGVLPQDYTKLDYIVNQSTAYIDTLIQMNNVGSVYFDMQAASTANYFLTGLNSSNNNGAFFIMTTLQQWYSRPAASFNLANLNRHNISLKSGEVACDGEVRTFGGGTITANLTTLVCGAWSGSTAGTLDGRRFVGKIYSAVIKDSLGNDIFVGVPAKDSANKVGLYDIVSKSFFTSASTTEFSE